MENITDAFLAYIIEKKDNEIPEKIYKKAEECLIDYLGVAYAGAKENKGKFEELLKNSHGSCTVIGEGSKTSDLYAAFINAFNAHTIELDDGHRFGMIHLGAVIISAVLAVAQREKATYEQILTGIIIGYEAAVKCAIAIQPGHKKKGFHTTGTCGSIGAAIGCSIVLDCTREQMKAVLSAAATSASGLLEIQENASTMKPYNAGHAAMAGVLAASMAMTGMSGPDDILGGERGMMYLLSDTVSMDKIFADADKYEIERIYVKPYTACRHCHSAMEAAISLSEEYQIPACDIEKIEVATYSLAVKGHDHTEIRGSGSAKLSIPYSVAASYILKNGGLQAFNSENRNNAEILELTKRVSVLESEAFSKQSPQKRIAEVRIILKSHTILEKCVEYAKGDPENPMSGQEIRDKFQDIMKWCGLEDKAIEILSLFNGKKVTTEQLFNMI